MIRKTGKLKKRRLLSRVGLGIAGLIVGLNLYRWNASALAGNALPMPFGIGMAVVLSGSMSPTLEVNDLVIVQERDLYETGDIVVYQSGTELIVHRIIAQEENRIVAQGDANNVPDEPIDVSAVKGAVTGRIPFVGAVVNILKRPVAGILLMICACLLMERSFRMEKQAEEEKIDEMKEEIRRLREELSSGDPKDSGGKVR